MRHSPDFFEVERSYSTVGAYAFTHFFWIVLICQRHMLRARKQLEVFRVIIETVGIFVMNMLIATKFATKNLLHNISMFKNPSFLTSDFNIPIFIGITFTWASLSSGSNRAARSMPPLHEHSLAYSLANAGKDFPSTFYGANVISSESSLRIVSLGNRPPASTVAEPCLPLSFFHSCLPVSPSYTDMRMSVNGIKGEIRAV